MKKIITLIIIALFSLQVSQAQEKSSIGYVPSSYYTFAWNTTFPLGDFHDWVSQPGAAGFDFGGQYFITRSFSAGFNFGWQRVAKDYDNQTYEIPDKGIAITATNYRFTWYIPFQVAAAYHMMPDRIISPYLQLGIGSDYMEHRLMIQEYDLYKTMWDFSLTPEAGIVAKFGRFSNWGGFLAFNYKWTTNKIEFYQTKSENLSMMNLKFGLSYIIR